MKQSRVAGFFIILTIYIIAALIGVFCYFLMPSEWPVRLLVADVIATVFVFLTSLPLRNASVYDPYWSVAPPIICTGFAIGSQSISPEVILLLIVVWFWGIRLTVNWALTFRNLNSQDWRYDDLQRQFRRAFPLISLAGIMLFPTLVVYGCTVPAVVFVGHPSPNTISMIGCLISLCGICLELVADAQMRAFRRTNTDKPTIIRAGLWRYARHPNYLGEILMCGEFM